MGENNHNLETEVLNLRIAQLEINRQILNGKFKVPVHLALGHEAIAVACSRARQPNDKILLTHRNIHFQLALGASYLELQNEYLLRENGLAGGKLGSMNLMNPNNGNIYTSNILGNNLAVALGVALGAELSNLKSVTWVVSGDGAIEEGIFYESLLNSASLNLPIIYVIENNEWSLATKINQRRKPIDLRKIAESLKIGYTFLESNDVYEYLESLRTIRAMAANEKIPYLVEIKVESLGGYETDIGTVTQRYVNYHAGGARSLEMKDSIIKNDCSDPLYVLTEGQSQK
jgi:TPP-dependent pyruvate/acetoin dehydrogenase alpha subunit